MKAYHPLRKHLQLSAEKSDTPIMGEECYFATILRNAKNIAVSHNNLRYIDWQTHNGCRPKQLKQEDAGNIHASGAHFARKVSNDQREDLRKQLLTHAK